MGVPRVPDYPTAMTSFSPSQALKGQNDYIDILGNPEIHPSKIHYHIPKWLRGFRHNNHYQVMIRKRNVFKTSGMEEAMPLKHAMMNKYLRKYFVWAEKHLDQKRWTNYEGVKFGPVPNHYKTRYPF